MNSPIQATFQLGIMDEYWGNVGNQQGGILGSQDTCMDVKDSCFVW